MKKDEELVRENVFSPKSIFGLSFIDKNMTFSCSVFIFVQKGFRPSLRGSDTVLKFKFLWLYLSLLKQCNKFKREKLGCEVAQFFSFISMVEIHTHIHLKSIFKNFQNTAFKKSRLLEIPRNTT